MNTLLLLLLLLLLLHHVQETCSDDGSTTSKTCSYMVLGGVFALELLALPPPVRRMNGWTFR
jgi:hypothetical protein